MAFQSGHKKIGGAEVGSKHEKTKQWQLLSDYLLDEGVTRFIKILKNSSDKDYTKIYLTMLDYFKPKQVKTTITAENQLKKPMFELPEYL